jgi:hypothetical protein
MVFRLRSINVCFIIGFWILSAVTKANAVGIDFGLDDGTKHLVDNIPSNIADAVLKVIKDGLPPVDKSIDEHLDKINKILDEITKNAIQESSCVAFGVATLTGSRTWDKIVDVLTRGVGVPGPIHHSISDLGKSVLDTRAHISAGTSPLEIANRYSDLLLDAAVIKCQLEAVKAPDAAVITVAGNINLIDLPDVEWSILNASGTCNSPHDCAEKRIVELQTFLRTQDSRDKDVAHVDKRVSELRMPPSPTQYQIHLGTYYDIAPAEEFLIRIRNIERAVLIARQDRETNARKEWDALIPFVSAFQQTITEEINALNQPSCSGQALTNIRNGREVVSGKLQSIVDKTSGVVFLDTRYSSLTSKLTNYADAARKRLAEIQQANDQAILRRAGPLGAFPCIGLSVSSAPDLPSMDPESQ